jgi:hypothetical protein
MSDFPLSRRIDDTATHIHRKHAHSGPVVGGIRHPSEHFVPLLRCLEEIRGLSEPGKPRRNNADDFDW